MSIHVALTHRTHYLYDRPVGHSPHTVRLRPAPHCRAKIISYALKVSPKGHFLNWLQDPFSNYQARLVFPEKITELDVEVSLVAEMAVHNPFDFFLESSADQFPFSYDASTARDLKAFLAVPPATPLLRDYVARVTPKAKLGTIDFVVELNQRLSTEINYLVRLDPGVQHPEETLTKRSGSCRDTAWLLVAICRHLGLAARFASGYLIQLRPDVKSLDGPSGAEADFTDLHAWCEVFLPGGGWIGLDPTSGLLAGEGHIPLACAPEPSSAAPVSGAIDECESTMEHTMEVVRVYESPRVTKPYTDEQWAEIAKLGHEIDAELKSNDVRLTMGGEPTFISIDNMDGAEWNFTALGEEKRRLSERLIARLQKQFAPGALLHFGQGKWYPGEVLPRWALGCYWRKDGEPIWRDQSLLSKADGKDAFTDQDAGRFIAGLAEELGIDRDYTRPAYEDVWYYLWREQRLPTNVDPLKSNLADKVERKRLAAVFDQGLDKVVGYCLPIRKKAAGGWESGKLLLRRDQLFLIPGDSPMGYRLPLDSMPWVSDSDYPYAPQIDPTVPRAGMPSWEALGNRGASVIGGAGATGASPKLQSAPAKASDPDAVPGEQQSAAWVVRTTLCVEPRGGQLHVFMPPLPVTEDYLELINKIETTAAKLKMPVVIEGETPSFDPRLNCLKVTPDPGVIEVNMHPVATWDDMVRNTETLYEEARQCRLATEKFMIDGRHVGTGGGNHIVLGGATPADSPFLRRPDLLRSMVAFWQHHPSLSYVFSGLFIGPTSQHPRIDEARNDSLYEMEIAFRQLPDHGEVPPWLVDRIFRNLLVDTTGNTHRAEFSIDKLYSPDSSSGRLGLVEMRGFEMPPHARMSLAQQMLLRALIARFWKEPYTAGELVRWRSGIHDRFMLPFYNEVDFQDVVDDLNRHGYPIRFDWFAPHFEFRFPRYGDIARRGIKLELRQALEPWHVLGEQGDVGGTVRYVDSSVDRLQVHVSGLVEGRHVIACNGYEIPMRSTGTGSEAVSGVRFRAWQPPECLHPTIPIQAPLTFDLVDRWNGLSVGGCTYHTTHPGGRGYDHLPVNSFTAESRRLERFFSHGHTGGPIRLRKLEQNPDYPFTLDLRRTAGSSGEY
jgi:uncharacterized protein (DUF2126 family)/transglutaminase-like putative cysteine protease